MFEQSHQVPVQLRFADMRGIGVRLAVEVLALTVPRLASRLDQAPCVFAHFADPAIADRVGVAKCS